MSSQSLSGWDFFYSILHCFDDFRSSCWSAQMTSLCISGLNFVLCLPVCIHGHSLALYLTQHHFSPSSSKLWMWFWFLCFVWRRWIAFTQYLHLAHVMPTFSHPWVFYSCLTGIVSRTSTCFILLFTFTSPICAHTFCPLFCFLYDDDLCMPATLKFRPPAGNFRKKKSNCLKLVAID